MWLFLLIYMMSTAGNNEDNADNDNMPIINLNSCMNSTSDNLCDYFLFDMCSLLNYMNNQIIYYFISDTILTVKQACFQQLMKQRKTSLELLGWDDTHSSDEEDHAAPKEEILTPVNSDSDCPPLIQGHKDIKINASNISKLTYNSIVAQYNNWLADVKTDFDEDSARFFISCQKIILISIILDKQLKITFNSITQDNSDLTHYWHKFEHWLQDIVLHDSSDKLKLSKDFTAACQLLKEDLNQFYLRLFNLEIQSECIIFMKDYKTRFLMLRARPSLAI